MPKMDGYEAAKKIRSLNDYYKYVPIIALTAHAGTKAREACYQSGMNDVITKPIRRNILLAAINMWSNTANPKRNEKNDASDDGAGIRKQMIKDDPMNVDIALEEFEDINILLRIVSQFQVTVSKQIQSMEDALKKGKTDLIQKEAHAIKGGASTLEALPLSKTAKALEDVCKKNEAENVGVLLNELKHEFKRLQAYSEKIFSDE